MSSVYVHVPFCRDRCTYCSFPTVADEPAQHLPLVDGILSEATRAVPIGPLETLYLGGGTPGLLSAEHLRRLLEGLKERFGLNSEGEITLEVNPTNVSQETLGAWAKLGVTRISVGIQTFDNTTLKSLARRHDAASARSALSLLSRSWEGPWSADLLTGWRGQTRQGLDRDIDALLKYQPPHISIYRLTVEPRTALHRLAQSGRIVALSDARADHLDPHWSERLCAAGYERYEVSNFATEGHRSRHNQVYWANQAYLGLGPGAASSMQPLRWCNQRDPASWLAAVQSGGSIREACEHVRPLPRLLESLAIGLRTKDGLDTARLDRRFTPAWRAILEGCGLEDLLESGLLSLDECRLVVPGAHLVKADSIVKELIYRLMQAESKETADVL